MITEPAFKIPVPADSVCSVTHLCGTAIAFQVAETVSTTRCQRLNDPSAIRPPLLVIDEFAEIMYEGKKTAEKFHHLVQLGPSALCFLPAW